MNEAFEKILERLESAKDGVCEHSTCEYTDECCFVDGINKAKEIVQKVAEEYNGGWISCSDSLPEAYDLNDYNIEDSASYLIQRRCGVMDVAHYIKIYGESYFSANSIEIKDVIAWQPLPEPYKERE